MLKILRIATRNSPLALWQANDVKARVEALHPGIDVELQTMTTRGDKLLDSPLARIGGKGLFVKELETALLDGRADIAVHSIKDVPAVVPPGLQIVHILDRENPHDAFVSNRYDSPEQLPEGAIVGTCSLRRQAQILARFPTLRVHNLRGNVNTRLAKLDNGEYDAIILASAGLIRLGMQARIAAELSIEDSLPAAGQGIVGIESRVGDVDTSSVLDRLHDQATSYRVQAERALSARLDGGCQVPIGAYSRLDGTQLWLRGMVASPDGKTIVQADATAHQNEAIELGVRVAEMLLYRGAGAVLEQLGLEPASLEQVAASAHKYLRRSDGGQRD
ncbi:MAG: hydroxymethylbilane synthase [Granulosicoccus sp.]|nr:hydroxymethylbilane synthase [Granulosicoccus sp.]